jgi:hypothetical protein
MQLPKLENFMDTRLGLHHAAQVIGGVRKVVAQQEPNWAHLGLQTVSEGVTTGSLPQVGTLTLNFANATIIHQPLQGSARTMPLVGHTQLSLADLIDEALANTGTQIKLDRAKVTSSAPIKVDRTLAADYARVLNWVTPILTKFRESLLGERSKLVVWPHGFDTSFLWFATPDASENAPHMAFGFSPGSEGIDRPYFYSYAHPVPDGLLEKPLVPPARWHNKGWTGMLLDYDELLTVENPDQTVESAFRSLYDTLRFS